MTDIFISFKNSEDGAATRESQVAEIVYTRLSESGRSVFMMNETLWKSGASNFRKQIDAALEEVSCLIVIGGSRPHFESEWVRYEWDTYLNEILDNRKRGELFTVRLDGASVSELPIALRKYQSFEENALEQLFLWVQSAAKARGAGAAERRFVYPAVFFAEEKGGYTVMIPDLEVFAEGPSIEEAFLQAKVYIKAYFLCALKYGIPYPPPTGMEALRAMYPENAVMFIDAVCTQQELEQI